MRRFLSLCVSLLYLQAFSLYASSPEKIEAIKLYNAGNFTLAKERLLRLTRQYPKDSELTFLLGRSALELKEYDLALAAFDRVLLLDPQHARSHLEIARIYYERKNYSLALKELDTALLSKMPPEVRRNLQLFRQKIENLNARNTWNATIMLGIEHDSNVNNDLGNKTFILPLYFLPIEGNKHQRDSAMFQAISLNDTRNLGAFERIMADGSINVFNKHYHKTKANNLTVIALSAGVSYAHDSYRVSLPITYDKILLGGKAYFHTFGMGIRYKQSITPSWLGEAGILAKKHMFIQGHSLRDNDELTLTLGTKVIFNTDYPSLLSVSTAARKTFARYAARTDIALLEQTHRLELSKEIRSNLHLNIAFALRKTRYDDKDAIFLIKREDYEKRAEIGASYSFNKHSSLMLTYATTRHISNHDPFNYDKNTVSGYYILSF